MLVAVVGASGGSGASTLAAAVASAAADIGRSVVLVDGAAGGAGIDVVLGIEHVPGVKWPDLAGCLGPVDGPGLLSRLPHSGSVAVLSHCRESAVRVGGTAVQGVLTGLVDVVDLVVLDAPRDWALDPARVGVVHRDPRIDHTMIGMPAAHRTADLASNDRPMADLALADLPVVDIAVIVSRTGVIELAALAATAPRVAARVAQTHLILRGRGVSRALARDVETALDLPVLGVLDDDADVLRDLAHGIPPGRSRGSHGAVVGRLLDLVGPTRGQVAS